MIERSRLAYFANFSYLDEKIGDIFEVLDATGQAVIILFGSYHADMLGERGLWFKMSFFEGSPRVPLMISSSDMNPGVVDAPVSAIDVYPTLCELTGVDMDELAP